jgi:hypothetical protein
MVALVTCAVPAAARAADPAAVTISACKSDSVTVAGKLGLTGTAARKARGATLQMRFQAFPLFGLPRSGQWRSAGKRTSGSGQEAFRGLGADNWVGTMSWRFKKGSKTVASGMERSQPVRVGSSRGRASCTIAEGVKPPDKTPPALFIVPADQNWHRAPAPVQLIANDDFSGVKNVSYSVDGGAKMQIPNGGSFTIANEGAHRVDWEATDVAGNTATRSDVVRVDAAPPTKPAFSKPGSVTASTKPTFQWSPSTDSGSGMKAYVLIVKRGDGSIASFQTLDATTTSAESGATLSDGETYTATVTAVDNTAEKPWTQESDPLTFRVDTTANITGVNPTQGSVLAGSAKDSSFTISLDRAADPSTVSQSTVKLERNAESGSTPSYTVGCPSSPCTTITLDPSGSLGEGRYTVTVSGVKSADEKLTFNTFTASYSVPFLEDSNGVDVSGGVCIGTDATGSDPVTVNAADGSETGNVSFDWSFSGGSGWKVRVLNGATELGSVSGAGGSGHASFSFPIPSGNHVLTVEFRSTCSGGNTGTLNTDNVLGWRSP